MTPLERAARAISLYSNGGDAWGEYGASYRRDYIEAARVALMAIREPSEAMVEAGVVSLSNSGVDDVRHDDPKQCWIDMIDLLLRRDNHDGQNN